MASLGMLAATVLMLQQAASSRQDLRAGLDTLYGGEFGRAAAYFETLAQRDSTDPAPLVFQAGAYIWWASALDSSTYELARIDSLLGLALVRARNQPAATADFWLATALGYRARQREEHGHGFSAAKDAKAMRDIYQRLLASDSTCFDCYLGLGVYEYGLARAGALSRFFARLIGLGSGNAERGIRYMRRAAHDGDLARVESTWVLAAALMREAARDPGGRAVLEREARGYVESLAARYPANPVFQRFLKETAGTLPPSVGEAIRPAARPPTAAPALAPIGWRQGGELAEHVVHVTLHRVGRDLEPLRDFLVAEPNGDQLADLLFALRESNGSHSRARGTTRAARVPHTGAAGWREVGAACDRADRVHDVFSRRVPHDEAVGTAFDELLHVLLRGHEIHHDGFGIGCRRFQVGEEPGTVSVGERGIEQYDLRFGVAQLGRGAARVCRARDDLYIGKCGEQAGETVAHQSIVLNDERTNPGGRRGCRSDPALTATTITCAVGLRHAVIQSASALRGDPALDMANGPSHTPPPSWASRQRQMAQAVIMSSS
ncbi:MAG TPA: hypothetical protein VGU74_17475 [Gemmatimonadales bacterium]|nr:hypothetical protein [Gemmatimonadales bacterium]